MKLAIYLFPHQDDEVFTLPQIRENNSSEVGQLFFYLTKNNYSEQLSELRRSESIAFLKLLNIVENNIIFVGHECSIGDGQLIDNLSIAEQAIASSLQSYILNKKYSSFEFICTAFEGGHHDHDAAFILARTLAKTYNGITKEFFLYNSHRSIGKIYWVASPFGLGKFIKIPYRFQDYILLVKALFIFKSQMKSMAGLWPFLFIKSLFRPLTIRTTFSNEPFQPQHNHVPLYERWGRIPQKDFIKKLTENRFLERSK